MSKQINRPPTYCKNAIASIMGWSDPKNGELLVSNKSLDLDAIEENYPGQVKFPIPEKTMEEINNDLINESFEDEIPDNDLIGEDETIIISDEETIDIVVETDVVVDEIDKEIIENIIEDAKELNDEDIIDYNDMTKAELVSYTKDVFDVVLNKNHNKDTLIKEIEELSKS